MYKIRSLFTLMDQCEIYYKQPRRCSFPFRHNRNSNNHYPNQQVPQPKNRIYCEFKNLPDDVVTVNDAINKCSDYNYYGRGT